MKLLILSVFVLFSNVLFSQNDDKTIYHSAIETIKNSTEFIEYININSPKNSNFKVAKNLYPICAFCSRFKDEVKCCGESTMEDLFSNKKMDGLELLGDRKGKYTLYFTNIENSYMIAEIIPSQKSLKSLIYLFKIENEMVNLMKVIR